VREREPQEGGGGGCGARAGGVLTSIIMAIITMQQPQQ